MAALKLLAGEEELWLIRGLMSRVIVLQVKGLDKGLHAPIKAYDDEDEEGGQGGGSTFVDGIRRLVFEGDSLAGQGLHNDLHAPIEAYDKDGGTRWRVDVCQWY